MKVAAWYWVLLALWGCAYLAASLPGPNLRTPIFLTFTFVAVNPLIGIPAFCALIAPLAALPFALRRRTESQGA